MDIYDNGERTCQACGGVEYWVECQSCYGEGWVNRYEEDPLWYDDKDILCTCCGGDGGWWWCQGACSQQQEAVA
jgi:DnaJ-class molecular chaperone